MSESSDSSTKESHDYQPAFACAEEVDALLACVTAKRFHELKCLPFVKQLRRCVEKQVRVSLSHWPAPLVH